MKKIYLLAIIFSTLMASAQEDAWVYFSEKSNADFYFSNPLEMLSQRAIDRRAAQNIPLDNLDVPINPDYINSIEALPNVEVLAKSKWLNAVHVRGTISGISAVAGFDFVSSIDFADNALDAQGRSSGRENRPRNRTSDTQVVFPYGGSSNQVQMLNGHLLHEQDYTGNGKIIAVMDNGFPGVDVNAVFQRLRDNNKILGGYNFIDRNEDVYGRGTHGTMVLSTMGGYAANQLVGTAPDAAYYLFITEDHISETPVEESYWVEAAEMADSLGVDVINTSLGYFAFDDPDYNYTYENMDGVTTFISRGADIAFSRGMVVVVSAGNSGNTVNPNIGAPADALNVLTVGAVDSMENYVGFSSIGPSFDGRIKPDVMAKGLDATIAQPFGLVSTANGTSFSGPIIAGMVASFWQAVPHLTNAEVVQFIKQSSSFYEMPTDEMGYGVPDFMQALNTALMIDENNAGGFRIAPNPAFDNVSVMLPVGIAAADLTLFNALGQAVCHKSIDVINNSMSVSTLQSGVYFYRIQSAAVVQSGRLIKD